MPGQESPSPSTSSDTKGSPLCPSSDSQPTSGRTSEVFQHAAASKTDESTSLSQAGQEGPHVVPRKAGRPISYTGDINSPTLTCSERSRIKRRIVNREAARRLRERKQGSFDDAQIRVAERTESSQKLACVLQERKAQQDLLQCQLHEAQNEWTEVVADYMQLQTDVQSMRRSLEMSLIMLEKGRQGSQPPLVGRPVQECPKSHFQRSLPTESSYSSGHLQSMLTPSQSSAYDTRETVGAQWGSPVASQALQNPMDSLGPASSSHTCFPEPANAQVTLRDYLLHQTCQ